jgi:hypothetical protein
MTQQHAESPDTEDRADVLVLRDDDGNLYALSTRQLHDHRVPDDQKAALEASMQSAEVTGYQTPGASAYLLPAGLGIVTTFNSPVFKLPVLPQALMQGPAAFTFNQR